MAKKTFHNLKPARQREIIEVAYREFIHNDYQSASLSRIIKELGLAKGSFYRYFSSKKELYLFLIECATSERLNTVENRVREPGMTLPKLLVINWKDKIEFELNKPLESAFQYRIFRERNNEEVGDLEIMFKREMTQKIKEMISTHFADSVRNDIDPDIIALLIIQVQLGFYDYMAIKHNDDLLKNIKEDKPLYNLPENEFENIIRSFTKLIEEGIMKKP
jgi:AcrR family transcriptional regulator